MRALFLLLLMVLAGPLMADPLAALRAPDAIVLMRHATAPGTGDPPGFRLEECRTQRNLSNQGRAEAQAMGGLLRKAGIGFAHVLTSQWCRTRETAELLDLGPVTPFPPANSFFANRGEAAAQTAQTLARLRDLSASGRVLVVTHQVNITALTGIVPRSGEAIITRLEPGGDGLVVTGRLPAP